MFKWHNVHLDFISHSESIYFINKYNLGFVATKICTQRVFARHFTINKPWTDGLEAKRVLFRAGACRDKISNRTLYLLTKQRHQKNYRLFSKWQKQYDVVSIILLYMICEMCLLVQQNYIWVSRCDILNIYTF